MFYLLKDQEGLTYCRYEWTIFINTRKNVNFEATSQATLKRVNFVDLAQKYIMQRREETA